jgi:hypothetical protein
VAPGPGEPSVAGGHDSHPESHGDKAEDGGQIVALEAHHRLESGRPAEVVARLAEQRTRAHHHELVLRGVGQPDLGGRAIR